jgi:hypothetical protein
MQDLLELSNTFDAAVRWTVQLMYCFSWRNPAKFEPAKSEG